MCFETVATGDERGEQSSGRNFFLNALSWTNAVFLLHDLQVEEVEFSANATNRQVNAFTRSHKCLRSVTIPLERAFLQHGSFWCEMQPWVKNTLGLRVSIFLEEGTLYRKRY